MKLCTLQCGSVCVKELTFPWKDGNYGSRNHHASIFQYSPNILGGCLMLFQIFASIFLFDPYVKRAESLTLQRNLWPQLLAIALSSWPGHWVWNQDVWAPYVAKNPYPHCTLVLLQRVHNLGEKSDLNSSPGPQIPPFWSKPVMISWCSLLCSLTPYLWTLQTQWYAVNTLSSGEKHTLICM